jgi:hypothetical protein
VTTFLVAGEPEAARLLNLPAGHAIAAMIQLGTPRHQITRLKRHPVESFTTIDSFDGTPVRALKSSNRQVAHPTE